MSSSIENGPFFLHRNDGFAEYYDRDDLLHPEENNLEAGDSLTETQYFGFSIPEENIHALCYMWYHPNLKTVTGGVWVWQGIKRHVLQCEMFDIRAYMNDKVLENDLHEYTLDNGYTVKTIEPLKNHRIRYSDPSHKNAFDIEYTAIMPPAMFGNRMHFEQAMKTKGELLLCGKQYKVNGYNIRDRSWGQLRPESHMSIPPLTWMTGVFSEDFAFNCSAFDHPECNPEWKDIFDFPKDQVLKGGWIYKDGETSAITSCFKRTVHNKETLFPESIEMEFTDDKKRIFQIRGAITAASSWAAWPNILFMVCLTRWEYNGMVGYGDTQEAQWRDFIKAFHP